MSRPDSKSLRLARAGCAAAALAAFSLAGCEPADPLEEVRALQAEGEHAASLEPLRELIREDPLDPETNFLYGRALVSTGQPTLATWSLRQAMEDEEWLEAAGIQLAHAALLTADFNEVVEATTQVLASHPEHAVALLLRAQARAHWRNDLEQALADAELALELDADLIEAYEPKILALLTLERPEEAHEALETVGERLRELEAPARSLAWHCSTQAIFAQDAGELEAAREQWAACLEAHPADPQVVGGAAAFFEARGDWERSLEVLERAFEERPGNLFRTALADRLRRTGRPAEGEELLREATGDDDPQLAAAAWSNLAIYRHALGDHAAAADALERAIELLEEVGTPDPQLLFRHADALVVSGRLDEALARVEDITVPAQRELILARVAQERGLASEAMERFDAALRLWPDNPWARYYAALAAEQVGDFGRALEEYRYAIRISAGGTDARTRVARLLLAENQPLLAYQLLFLQVETAPLEPEGELLSMYLIAKVANPKQLQSALLGLRAKNPGLLPGALARAADGVAERAGSAAALSLLIGAPGVDYGAPSGGPALFALVRHAHAAGRPEVAEEHVEAALAAHPEAGFALAARGLHRELGGDAAAGAEAYRRALQSAPGSVEALAGLARTSLESDPNAALQLLARAAALDPAEAGHGLAAARILRAAGRAEQASRQLEALLRKHPYDREVAKELVSLDLERGSAGERTVELARRAVRFRGGAEAYDLLSRVHTALEQPEEAEAAAVRAAAIRERAEGKAAPAAGSESPGEPPAEAASGDEESEASAS